MEGGETSSLAGLGPQTAFSENQAAVIRIFQHVCEANGDIDALEKIPVR